ncbi:AMP-binding protein [Paraburkholderia fungorum]|uniref:AMP-binding protein n=1 Tax=Paraburkholderia fungorum TaxID=134537 RepID=UPI001C1EA2C3|nr:AMP-binding protein [Paraburkholderia fungorum]MBU7435841.1 AMP-binding protein [Paraburkholderia fungorum]
MNATTGNLQSCWIDSADDIELLERMTYSEVVPVETVPRLLQFNAERFENADALMYLHSANAGVDASPDANVLRVSHRQLLDLVLRAGAMFRACGVQRDEPVAIIAPHMPAVQVAMWGAQLAGCAFPVNYLLGADHIAQLLRAAKVRVAVVLGETDELPIYTRLREALELAECIEHVFEMDPDERRPAPSSFQTCLRGFAADDALLAEVAADTVASIYHTGGTTGLPKLLTHSHRNEVHTSWFASRYYHFGAGDRMLNGFPLFHVAGAFVYGLSALAAGGSVFIPTLTGMRNAAFVQSIWSFARRYGVTHLGCVPTVLSALLNSECGDRASPVRVALTGGSPLPTDLAARFENAFGIPVRNIFGMTECVGVVSIEPAGAPRVPGSVGLPLPYTKVVAIPVEDACETNVSRFCGAMEVGQLAIRGPHVSAGYLDATLNASTFTQDGWLLSGDLGYVDDERRIFLTGRAKDLIIRGAHNIDPRAIEEAVQGLDDVLVCAAVGEPDAYAGELPVVFVVLRDGATRDTVSLLEAVKPRIFEPSAMPKRIVVLDALPLTAIGKIYKPALRAMAAQIKIQELIGRQLPGVPVDVTCTETAGRVTAGVSIPGAVDSVSVEQLRRTLGDLPVAIEWTR